MGAECGFLKGLRPGLALPRFEPAVRLVDDVGAATPTDHAAIAVARLERLQAVANLHGARLSLRLVWSKIRKAAPTGQPLAARLSENRLARQGSALRFGLGRRERVPEIVPRVPHGPLVGVGH